MKAIKPWKKLLAIFLAATLCISAAACEDGGASSSSQEGDSSNDIQAQTQSQENEDVEYDQIVYALWTGNKVPDDCSDVEEAINQITRDEIGVEVTIRPIAAAEYANKVGLAMASGEQLDIFNVLSNLTTYVSKNQVLDITDLIPECAQGAVDQVGERFMNATKMNGQTYAIPTDKGVALNANWYYRKSVLDELGIDPSTIQSVDDLPAVFDKLLEIHPEMVPFVGSNGDSGLLYLLWNDDIDFLGDSANNALGGVAIGDDPTVVDLYETQQFKDLATMIRDWYNKNYILKDAATTTSTVYEQLASGKGFSYIGTQAGSYGAAEASTLVGETVESIALAKPYMGTNSLGVAWAINSQCKTPESALKFLNLTYTNEDVVNYLVFGIEGRDYVKVNEREVEYPEGLNADTVPYTAQFSCGVTGSQFKQYEMVGTPEDNKEVMRQDNENADLSPFFGFNFDSASVTSEYTAATNVVKQYLPGISCGSIDPETELPKFVQALKDAGGETIIAEKQKQLDAWLEANS